eukprot:SAG22_NODE_102_length_20195_cov_3.248308_19_plen_211_part_00
MRHPRRGRTRAAAQPHSIVMQAHSAQDRATAARAPCSRPNWRFGPFGAGEERPSSPAQNGPPAQLAGSHGALVTAGPRQLGTKAAGQAGSPRRAALVEPHAASTRCSRSALLTLLIAPAEPDPEGLPGAGRLQLGSETAARTCQRAACGLPAATALRAAGALSASPVCSGPAAAGASLFGPWSVRQLLGAFGGAGGAARGNGREQKRILW